MTLAAMSKLHAMMHETIGYHFSAAVDDLVWFHAKFSVLLVQLADVLDDRQCIQPKSDNRQQWESLRHENL